MRAYDLKDSGKRRQFASGAVRDDDGSKLRYDLIWVGMLDRLAEHLRKGALKYGEDNWQKGIPDEAYKASLLRHVYAVIKGQDDEDHLSAVVFNVMGLMHNQENRSR